VNKTEAVRAVIEAAPREPIVFTTGYSCRIAKHVADRPNHFYMTGSMGLAASIATGLALAGRMHAVAVDGDGSLLMNPGCLITAGMTADLPLVHVLLDDGAYASTGGQDTPSARADFVAWAKACGYASATRTRDPVELALLLRRALATPAPSFIHCPLADEDERVPPRVDLELAGHFRRFSRHVATL